MKKYALIEITESYEKSDGQKYLTIISRPTFLEFVPEEKIHTTDLRLDVCYDLEYVLHERIVALDETQLIDEEIDMTNKDEIMEFIMDNVDFFDNDVTIYPKGYDDVETTL
ncbi:hypothetical protein KG089_05250 [Carnobacteriaceae bacterium zg-ZUI252]|nr:hypothetical protein [Carnobacteriaceae bacterium zg-ZUI252]